MRVVILYQESICLYSCFILILYVFCSCPFEVNVLPPKRSFFCTLTLSADRKILVYQIFVMSEGPKGLLDYGFLLATVRFG